MAQKKDFFFGLECDDNEETGGQKEVCSFVDLMLIVS